MFVASGCIRVGPIPSLTPPEDSKLIDCGRAAQPSEVAESSHLDPSCIYAGGISVTASHLTLDCRGALIQGASQNGTGILIHTPTDVTMSDVTIRNCRVDGFLNSIRATRDGFRDLAQGAE